MRQTGIILADQENFGRILTCEHGAFHVQIGHATLSFSQDGYMRFVDLVNTSAANFESAFHAPEIATHHPCDHSAGKHRHTAQEEDLC